ncbi:MAG: 30S ribosomal protein S20 [Planctomycetota bacterium]|nr:30S ribosomal protein S20 [Planctomycetota bacterium]
MAHSVSAEKRMRQNVKRQARNRAKRQSRNRWRKAKVKAAVKDYSDAVTGGDAVKAAETLKNAYRQLDRTAAKGTIHKNAANRKKSRLARKLKALKAPAA